MIIVADNVFIASNCPKFLEQLATEIGKAAHYAFRDQQSFDRFIEGVRLFVGSASKSGRRTAPVSMYHTQTDEGGTVTIRRSDLDCTDYIRLHYFFLEGHVHVSQDGLSFYQEPFIEEGGVEDV